MKTAIVILNWNGKKLLAEFLPSVIKNSAHLATIYVADNASTDTSVAFVQAEFPQVKIIQNASNGGYAKGYNDALQYLDEELLILMNSDIKTTSGWLEPMIKAFETDSNLGAAQPKLLDLKKKTHFEYAGAAGGFLDSLGYPFCRGRIFDTCEEDTGQYNDSLEIFWATGACLAVRKSVFWQAGALDEDFFAHQEEIDLCWRIKNLGYSIQYIGESVVYHLGGATLEQMNPKKTFLNFRNNLMLLLKNVAGFKVYPILFARMCLDGIAAFKFLTEGKPKHFTAVLKAHFNFYAQIPKLLNKRARTSGNQPYAKVKSIVWEYFIRKNKHYTDIF
ncbi:glycosyltransferase family 2 protein [Leeuwenhoekiella palythoae]|uniref:glycosyltransferase family 2 protein n=1 Tax=Leeuwenhoekiella palythoae TaxID=573501 RepID=UPI000E9F5826|nr:glycosyltransferase family 2 protein [Leeuwenhoekiella palythoae]UBZ09616.1 glycosyltransferase family 2 protein [Leeuwenhoekiella palythoae]HAX16782.1 dTDP-Rha--alpha-D-GlcNAc-pyrophosphate polyprenol alpha-3-L-rhamnosyltransferase [Leeuwenhoekiella sp.]HBO28755.1 dTDP-Rha--alpha-D-GlcNAc-pyrophosphate polyprenol alpha-3-L-rhamnosyltransferase [Leeuwenhoekiella sp.]|tara:strand:- start:171 stop:1169 length:999 start_codon:yes stop_codon:yes gene_type:complete